MSRTKTGTPKSVKKTLTIPEWLNDFGLTEGINFSSYLVDAIKRALGKDVVPLPEVDSYKKISPRGLDCKYIKKTLTIPQGMVENLNGIDINLSYCLCEEIKDRFCIC